MYVAEVKVLVKEIYFITEAGKCFCDQSVQKIRFDVWVD
jgi:hypothetical protein